MLDLDVSQIIIQTIAFLVMLWVMKRFGWKPLLEILESRRKKIRAEFAAIDSQKEDIKQLTFQYEEKLKEIEEEMRKKVQEAVMEGQRVSAKIQEEAQVRAKEIVQKVKSDIAIEMAQAKLQFKKEMVNLVMNSTKKILQEELDASRQKQLISNFLDEV